MLHYFPNPALAHIVSIHAPRHRGAMPRVAIFHARRRDVVSIHAPRHRGAMPGLAGASCDDEVVSIHAPRHRGAMRSSTSTACASTRCFNPRPPSPRGDAQRPGLPRPDRSGFNPRPPSPRGDALAGISDVFIARRFQSTPPVTEGRCADVRRDQQDDRGFNPRPPSPRGDAESLRAGARHHCRFNPRPPSPRGDACGHRGSGPAGARVSIHAPRHRGAMRCSHRNCRADQVQVSIHAPRHRGAMPCSVPHRIASDWFQSTPPVTEGRCDVFDKRLPFWSRFNPRPPSPRGDAVQPASSPGYYEVSIHAPRHRGAMRIRGRSAVIGNLFQSTPPVTEGRCALVAACTAGDRASFNPRPPSPRGDAGSDRRMVIGHAGFNPRPPSPRGDAFSVSISPRACTRFNPRPPSPRGDAVKPGRLRCPMPVSIHAPRHRGAMPAGQLERQAGRVVSIHAPRHRGAMRRFPCLRRSCRTCFNPRPPSPRGDALRT